MLPPTTRIQFQDKWDKDEAKCENIQRPPCKPLEFVPVSISVLNPSNSLSLQYFVIFVFYYQHVFVFGASVW